MRVLVACEFSGTVRDAFAALGHDAAMAQQWSDYVLGRAQNSDITAGETSRAVTAEEARRESVRRSVLASVSPAAVRRHRAKGRRR